MRRLRRAAWGRAVALKKVFTSPRYALFALVAAAAYYLLFFYIVNYGSGLPFATAPVSLVYALIASSAVLVSLSAYVMMESLRVVTGGASGAVGVCTASFGCMIAGCGCYAPAVSSLLYLMGLGAIQVSGIVALLGNYQAGLISLLIAINLALICYQSGRTSHARKISGKE